MACQLLTVFVTAMVARTLAQTIEYECFPNGTVRTKNPDKSVYTALFANNSANICEAFWEDESTKEYSLITNCEKNLPILLTFMNRPKSDDFILGGTENVNFLIRCSEISHAGINKTAEKWAPVALMMTRIQGITPFFAVFTRMYENNSKTVVIKSTFVGISLYWAIEGPEEYHLMPLRCDAFPGLTSDNENMKKNIIVNGCTVDSSLVGNFTLVKMGEVASELLTFRFYNSPFVTLQCIVRVCPEGSVSCDLGCPARRKRSSAVGATPTYLDRVETVFTHLTVHDSKKYISESSSADTIVAMAIFIMLPVIARCLQIEISIFNVSIC